MKLWLGRILVGLILFSLLAFCFQPAAARDAIVVSPGTTRYVAPNGQDSGNCTSPTSPCRTIQYAVNQATSGDTILVAAGVYTYTTAVDQCTFLITRAVVCLLDKQLIIKGSYDPNNWLNSDPNQNPSIIEGQNAYRGVAVIAYQTSAAIVMDGFTIQNGLAQGNAGGVAWAASGRGGGLWSQGGRVELKNMVFLNNVAKGANMTNIGGDAAGGAIMIESVRDQSRSKLTNIIFRSNKALGGFGETTRGGLALGGALFVYQSYIEGENLIFQGNIARAGDTNGYGEYQLRADALGGAVSLQQNSEGVFRQLRANENQVLGGNARGVGGGAFGGAISAEDSSLSVMDIYLEQNIAQGGKGQIGGFAMGGGLVTDDSTLSLDRGEIKRNQSIGGETLGNGTPTGGGGGGLYLTAFTRPGQYTLHLSNLIIADNVVGMTNKTAPGGSGAGLVVQALTANIDHATISNNQVLNEVRFGQAIMVTGLGDGKTSATLNLKNSIVSDHENPFTDNTSAITVVPGSTLNLNKVLFANNTNNLNDNAKPVSSGTINGINTVIYAADVGFVSRGSPNFDYHLSPTSVAIDQVSTSLSTDYEGEVRPHGKAYDLGADEYVPLRLLATPNNIVGITDNHNPLILNALIITNRNQKVNWSARANVSWILFGLQPTNSEAHGQTGEMLTLYIMPENLSEGWHRAQITVTSDQADSVVLDVNILIVSELKMIHLPLVIKGP